MYQHIKWLIFPIAIVIFVSSLAITFAQSTDIVPSDEILVLQGSTLYRFQADAIATTTGLAQPTTTTKLSNVSFSNHDLVSLGIDPSHQFLYSIQVLARDNQRQPRPTVLELIQTNLITGEQKVLMTQPGLFQFIASPDGQRVLVAYFETGAEYGVGWLRACILDLKSSVCSVINDLTLAYYGNEWIDATHLVLLSWNHQLYTYDIEKQALTPHSIPDDQWDVLASTHIPGTQQILLSATRLPVDLSEATYFLLYDLQTGQLTQLNYTALATQPYIIGVDRLLLSSDGHYLLYAGLDKRALIDFTTGQLIAEFDNVFQASWLKDGSSLVMNSPNGVQVYDVRTQQAKTLMASTIDTVILS
jgi:hypothetical protein